MKKEISLYTQFWPFFGPRVKFTLTSNRRKKKSGDIDQNGFGMDIYSYKWPIQSI